MESVELSCLRHINLLHLNSQLLVLHTYDHLARGDVPHEGGDGNPQGRLYGGPNSTPSLVPPASGTGMPIASLACHCEQELYEVLGGGGEPFPHQLGHSPEGADKVGHGWLPHHDLAPVQSHRVTCVQQDPPHAHK